MPHIIVEYSDTLTLDKPQLLNALHDDLAARETVTLDAIKTRAIAIEDAVVGDRSHGDQMIHITVRLLAGRTDELRKEMAQGMLDVTRRQITDPNVTITVETADLHGASYTK